MLEMPDWVKDTARQREADKKELLHDPAEPAAAVGASAATAAAGAVAAGPRSGATAWGSGHINGSSASAGVGHVQGEGGELVAGSGPGRPSGSDR
jgi:hypothetical protein